MQAIKQAADQMIKTIIAENLPEQAVKNTLKAHGFINQESTPDQRLILVSIGKAAWTMAKSAKDYLGDQVTQGIVITKYGHSSGEIPGIEIHEAGHPTLDENTIVATQKAIDLVSDLTPRDQVLFLVSGGGSSLFEVSKDGITLEILQNITQQLLACGADIVAINTIRKRLSKVKAGGFANLVAPATIFSIVLSDVLGDRLDSIASGPASPDHTTTKDVIEIIEKYNLTLPSLALNYLSQDTPKKIENVTTVITGSVRSLTESAFRSAQSLGYTPYILTTTLSCEASEAGKFLASIATDTRQGITHFQPPAAIILGGETVVTLKGNGKGGRNQEIALSSAKGISGLHNTIIFSLGSDGTDGPTDAAGGIVDGTTAQQLLEKNTPIDKALSNNDAYTALQSVGGLIMTGPTGTNVNDVSVILIS